MAKKPDKPVKEKSEKLNINNEMAQLDRKHRAFYDELNEQERKDFSTFLMLRWGSCISSDNPLVQQYYVMSMNEVNKHFFDIGRHPKLQWLLMTTVSPTKKTQKHEWIAFKGKASKDKRANFLAQLYPTAKMADLEVLSKSMSDEQLKSELLKLGWEDKKIKEAVK